MGDYIQTIAVKQALDTLYKSDYVWYDRDSISFFNNTIGFNNQIVCIMQGWFSHTHTFLPSSKITPVWIGTHFTYDIQSFIRRVLVINPNYFSSTVGCRDIFTLNFFKKNHINSYLSRCLTLTLPSKNSSKSFAKKTYLVDISQKILKYIPKRIKENSVILNQKNLDVNFEHWTDSLQRTKNQIKEYEENACLVITTALHCACPCIAMGIPVILIAENEIENNTRFSALSGILNPVQLRELKNGKVNWDPSPLDISDLKKAMLNNIKYSIDEVLYKQKETVEAHEIREFIENYHI